MLSEIEIKKISEDNFNRYSFLSFNRHQEVKECWRKRGGEYPGWSRQGKNDWIWSF